MIRVLLVDDDKDQLDLLEIMLGGTNKTTTAKNGEEALQILKNKDIDIVISDIDMPIMNGLELLVKMSEMRLSVPVIAVSGQPNHGDEAMDKGAAAFLCKPFHFDVLSRLIQKYARP